MTTQSLLDNFEMTKNAKRFLENYFKDIRDIAEKEKVDEDSFQRFVENQIYRSLNQLQEKSYTAEVIMDVVEEIGKKEELLQEYQRLAFQPKAGYRYKKLRLSSKDKVIAGVCGGIAEYFQIDAILVRAAFIACLFVGGTSIFLYPLLWIVLLDRKDHIKYPPLISLIHHIFMVIKCILAPIFFLLLPRNVKKEPKEDKAEFTAEKEATQKESHLESVPEIERKSALGKFFGFIALLFMSFCIYLPATFLLIGGASYFLWGIFYPIVNVEGFQFSFMALETPGIVLAICLSIFALCLFLMIMTFAGRLHFKAKVLGKNSLVITILAMIMSFFGTISSFGMTYFQNKEKYTASLEKQIPVSQEIIKIGAENLEILNHYNIKVNRLKIRAEKNRKHITSRYTLKVRGVNEERARESLERIRVNWEGSKGLFPKIKKSYSRFHFEEIDLELLVPADKALLIEGNLRAGSQIQLKGDFNKKTIVKLSHTRFHLSHVTGKDIIIEGKRCYFSCDETKAKSLKFKIDRGCLILNHIQSEDVNIQNIDGHVSLQESEAKWDLTNERGFVGFINTMGSFSIENEHGKVQIHNHIFKKGSSNTINSLRGYVDVNLGRNNIPKINIQNSFGKVKNKLPYFSTSDATLDCNIKEGKLKLKEIRRGRDRHLRGKRKHHHFQNRREEYEN